MKKFAIIILLTLAAGVFLVLPQNVAFTMRTKTPKAPDVTKTFSKHDKDCHFAVVCGGVHSVAEFLALDEPAYWHFDKSKLFEYIQPEDMYVFMAYKKDGKLYFTRHKVLVRAGEKILSDGENAILERCGNLLLFDRILATPFSEIEPSPTDLGGVMESGSETPDSALPPAPPETSTEVAETLPPNENSPPEGSTTFPSGFCCTGGSPGVPTPPSKPSTPVPEPKEFYLTLVGLLCIFLMVRIR